MLWGYFYCYQLTLDAHLRTSLEHINTMDTEASPTVVYCNKSNAIVQINSSAQQAGIEVGHGLAQAAAFCPEVHILPFEADNEHSLLTQLATRLYPFASDMVLDNHNGLAVRLDNLTHYYGGHRALWNTLRHELTQSQTHYYFATAWTIDAAKVLAYQKLNRYIVHPEKIKKALSQCSLSYTALSSKVVESLSRVGITQVHQLLAMPVHELGRRFDNATITYLTALRGETYPRVTLFRPASHFVLTSQLPFDIENTQHLIPYITQQLEHFSHYLRARNLQSLHICVGIHFREAPAMNISIQSAILQSDVKSWVALLALKIENIELVEPATAVTLSCEKFESVEGNNNDFFSNRFNDIAQKQLIGRLNAKLGDNSTFQPKAVDSHQFDNMTVNAPSKPSHAYRSDIAPTFTFSSPQPLTAPSQVCFGPVRLSSEWWHRTPYQRDYFIAQNEQGVRMLIFKDEDNQWWTQGIFC